MIAAAIVIIGMAAFVAAMLAGCRFATRDWTPAQWAAAHETNAQCAEWNRAYR